jgi:hypothetical protein
MADKFDDIFSSFNKFAKDVAASLATNLSVDRWNEQIKLLEKGSVDLMNTFGTGRDRIVEMKQSMGDATKDVKLLGGEFSDVVKIAQDVGTSLNRNIILTKDAYADLYATAKATGQAAGPLTKNFTDAGFSIYQINQNMQKVVDTARTSGINVAAVSSQVLSNLDMMDKYNFSNGVEGLGKMVTQGINLKISVDEIKKSMDKAFKPEGAIQMAAELQRLGVAQSELLDPLRLMDLSRNDPAEFQNQIAQMSKQFVEFNEETKSFVIAPGAKEQMVEVAHALGMTEKEFAKMAKASAEMEDKMKKISFPDMFTEEQKTFVANMAQMGKGGEYMLRVDGEDLKIDEAMVKIQSMSEEERKKFLAETKPKSMEDLTKEQLGVMGQISANIWSIADRMGVAVASSKTQEMANEASIELSNTIPKLFSGEKFQTESLRKDLVDKPMQDIIKSLEGGKPEEILSSLSKAGENTSAYFKGMFDDVIGGADKAMSGLADSTNPLIITMGNLVTGAGKLLEKHENLNTSMFSLNENITKVNTSLGGQSTETITKVNTSLGSQSTEATKNLKNIVETKPATTTAVNELKFTNPIEIKIKLDNFPAGMTEEQVLNMIKEGKIDQELVKAIQSAEKMKTDQK